MLGESWSPDMIVGQVKKEFLFSRHLIPRTSTLYHWIHRGIMKTKNIDLLEQASRKPRNDSPIQRENRRGLGASIGERPEEVESRKHFGHWEIDTLIGTRDKDDPVLLKLVERKTLFEIMFKIGQQYQPQVDLAMKSFYEQIGDQAENVFKTITSDNGSRVR